MVIKNQSMTPRGRSPIAVVLFTVIFVGLMVITLSSTMSALEFDHKYGMFVDAHPLPNMPEAYFSISNPDPYLLKAITPPSEPVSVPPSYYPKYDIVATYGNVTSLGSQSIEYEGGFYNIGVLSADPAGTPFFTLFVTLPICWLLFGVSIFTYIRRRKRASG